MNGVGPQGSGYTGIGITGQDALIYGNLLVTEGIDPTYLALTPQTSVPSEFVNPLWVDSINGNALRSKNIYMNNSPSTASISLIPDNTNQLILSDGSSPETKNIINYSSTIISDSTYTTTINSNNINIGLDGATFYGTLNCNIINSFVTNITTILITDVSNSETYYPTFVDGSGNKPLNSSITTNPLTYNPSTGDLTASLFVCDLSGNITTNASNVDITDVSDSIIYYPTFVDGTYNKPLYANMSTNPFTYDPSSGYLTASKFIGDVSGNNIFANNVVVKESLASGNILFTNNTGEILSFDAFSYGPNRIQLNTFIIGEGLTGNCNIVNNLAGLRSLIAGPIDSTTAYFLTTGTGAVTNTRNALITDVSDSIIYYPTFVDGSGNRSVRADISNGPISYNPSTKTLTTAIFNGDLSGNVLTSVSSTGATFYPTFVSATTGNNRINVNPNLTYNPSTSIMNFSAPPICNTSASTTNELVNFNNFQQTTFTPELITSNSGTCVYTTQTGSYIKLSNFCMFSAVIQISSITASSTDTLSVSLPFANNSDSASSFDVGSCDNMVVDCVRHVLSCAPSDTEATIYFKTSASPGTNYTPVTVGDVSGNSFRIRYGGSYICAT
jgi:hypothetical protein